MHLLDILLAAHAAFVTLPLVPPHCFCDSLMCGAEGTFALECCANVAAHFQRTSNVLSGKCMCGALFFQGVTRRAKWPSISTGRLCQNSSGVVS